MLRLNVILYSIFLLGQVYFSFFPSKPYNCCFLVIGGFLYEELLLDVTVLSRKHVGGMLFDCFSH
jgi:hypothetical protein